MTQKEIDARLGILYNKMTDTEKALGIGQPEFSVKPGTKYDSQKLRWELLPWSEIEDMVRSLTFGAVKYEEDNWKKVKPTSRYIGAMMRHIVSHEKGETIDKESGVPHLAVVAVDALFALWHHKKEHPEKYKDYQGGCQHLLYGLQSQKDAREVLSRDTQGPYSSQTSLV